MFTAYIVTDNHGTIRGVHVYEGAPKGEFLPQDFGYPAKEVLAGGWRVEAVETSDPKVQPEALKVKTILQHSDAYNGMQLRKGVERAIANHEIEEKDAVQGEFSARIFAVCASKMHSDTMKVTIKGLTYQGEDMGDWQVVATCKRHPVRPPQDDDGEKITRLSISKDKSGKVEAEMEIESTKKPKKR